ncbi:hypothetical protein ABZ905_31960 [Streptomyces parvus]|uniref:hypothetical protein n=1 Tax=Streptomyces parvus TaxID=66428 RepID=UPI0033DFC607
MRTTIMTRAGLLRSAALTICGRREGKLESCNSCLRKADAVVRLAKGPDLSTAVVPRIADVVCDSDGQPCAACWDKATTLLLELRP